MKACPAPLEEPPFARCRRFLTRDVRPNELTLDIGCGSGELMLALQRRGARTIGIEVVAELVAGCREQGLDVRWGRAEELPFEDATFDRIVCGVVMPYLDERRAVAEWSRVLKPGGRIFATYHGLGYALHYMASSKGLRRRIYGCRMFANTLFHRLFRRRLPGFWGDTLCQTSGSLRANYRRAGLQFVDATTVTRFLGLPGFLAHRWKNHPFSVEKSHGNGALRPAS